MNALHEAQASSSSDGLNSLASAFATVNDSVTSGLSNIIGSVLGGIGSFFS